MCFCVFSCLEMVEYYCCVPGTVCVISSSRGILYAAPKNSVAVLEERTLAPPMKTACTHSPGSYVLAPARCMPGGGVLSLFTNVAGEFASKKTNYGRDRILRSDEGRPLFWCHDFSGSLASLIKFIQISDRKGTGGIISLHVTQTGTT